MFMSSTLMFCQNQCLSIKHWEFVIEFSKCFEDLMNCFTCGLGLWCLTQKHSQLYFFYLNIPVFFSPFFNLCYGKCQDDSLSLPTRSHYHCQQDQTHVVCGEVKYWGDSLAHCVWTQTNEVIATQREVGEQRKFVSFPLYESLLAHR